MKWISVEDKLPSIEGMYIGFINIEPSSNGFLISDEIKEVRFVFYKSEQMYDRSTESEVVYKKIMKWSIECVTHWMPLPDHPEEK